MRLKDKVAITTGAASGIGKATAILFAEHGAQVVVADIDENGANQTVSEIRDAGNEATYVQTDVTISDDTRADGTGNRQQIRKTGHSVEQCRHRNATASR